MSYSDPFGLCPENIQPGSREAILCAWIEAGMMAAGADIGALLGGGAGLLTGPGAVVASPAGAMAGAAGGATAGFVAGRALTNWLFSDKSEEAHGNGSNSPQDKRLSSGEIKRLEDAGFDVHEIKADALGTSKGLSKYDLFKTQNGDIVVKPKRGPGESLTTGLNINDY